MESIFLTVKFVLFLAMEIFVVATVVGAMILGLYEVVKNRVRESRILDQVTPETLPVISESF